MINNLFLLTGCLVCVAFTCLFLAIIVHFLCLWLIRCYSYSTLVLEADAHHGNVVCHKWKKKHFWKLQFVIGVFFSKDAFTLIKMGNSDSLSCAGFFYSPNGRRYVRGKDL